MLLAAVDFVISAAMLALCLWNLGGSFGAWTVQGDNLWLSALFWYLADWYWVSRVVANRPYFRSRRWRDPS